MLEAHLPNPFQTSLESETPNVSNVNLQTKTHSERILQNYQKMPWSFPNLKLDKTWRQVFLEDPPHKGALEFEVVSPPTQIS